MNAKHAGVTKEESRAYLWYVRNGKKAEAKRLSEKLITRNMGLVRKVINRFRVKLRYVSFGDAWEDLEQAGAIGLLQALNIYDADRARFSSIAMWKILHEIQRELCKQMVATGPRMTRIEHRESFEDLPSGVLSYEDEGAIEARDMLDAIGALCTDEELAWLESGDELTEEQAEKLHAHWLEVEHGSDYF